MANLLKSFWLLVFFIGFLFPHSSGVCLAQTNRLARNETKIVTIEGPETKDKSLLKQQVRQAFLAGDWIWLDKKAQELRASKSAYTNGEWKLRYLYSAIDSPDTSSHVQWERSLAIIEQWAAARPDSVTARILLADRLIDFAWKARGTGYANTVTEEGWQLMKARLEKAEQALTEAKGLPEKCPVFYSVSQNLALGQGWSRERYEELFEEGIKQFPTFESLYWEKAYWLAPQWYGKKGEAQAFLESSANRIGGAAGDKFYARMAYHLSCSNKGIGLSWAREKKGFALMLKDNPDCPEILQRFIRESYANGDRNNFLLLLPRLDNRVDTAIWGSAIAFVRAISWAKGDASYVKLATAEKRGDFSNEIKILQDRLELHRQMIGDDHKDTLGDMVALAHAYNNGGKYQESAEVLNRATALAMKEYKADDARMLGLYVENGNLMRALKRNDEAEKFYMKALSIHEARGSLISEAGFRTISALAVIKARQGKFEEAQVLSENALQAMEKLTGKETNSNAIEMLNDLQQIYIHSKKYDAAAAILKKELSLLQSRFGSNHYMTAYVLSELAGIYHVQNNLNEAEKYYRLALDATKKSLGESHPSYQRLKYGLSQLQQTKSRE